MSSVGLFWQLEEQLTRGYGCCGTFPSRVYWVKKVRLSVVGKLAEKVTFSLTIRRVGAVRRDCLLFSHRLIFRINNCCWHAGLYSRFLYFLSITACCCHEGLYSLSCISRFWTKNVRSPMMMVITISIRFFSNNISIKNYTLEVNFP